MPLNTRFATIFAGGPTGLIAAETITLVSRTTKRIPTHLQRICECDLSRLQYLHRLPGWLLTLGQDAIPLASWQAPLHAEVRDLPSQHRQRRGPGRMQGPSGQPEEWFHP